MLAAVLMTVGLLCISAFLLWSHRRTWQAVQREQVHPLRLEFGRRQFRRRSTASLLIGLAGLVLLASPWVTDPDAAYYWRYWFGLLLLVCCLCLLALIDAYDSLRYFRAVRSALLNRRDAEQAKLAGRPDDSR